MPRGKRERTYRGIFVTPTGEYLGLDFYADNLTEARDHAGYVAGHDAIHTGIIVKLVRVITCDKDEFRTEDAGSWFSLNEPLNS